MDEGTTPPISTSLLLQRQMGLDQETQATLPRQKYCTQKLTGRSGQHPGASRHLCHIPFIQALVTTTLRLQRFHYSHSCSQPSQHATSHHQGNQTDSESCEKQQGARPRQHTSRNIQIAGLSQPHITHRPLQQNSSHRQHTHRMEDGHCS